MKQKITIFFFVASFVLLQGGTVFSASADGEFLGKCIGGTTCNSGANLSCQNGRCLVQGGTGPQNPVDIFLIIDNIVNLVFSFVIILSVMFVILAGFEFVTGGPEGVAKARQKLIWVIVGIGIAMLARAFPEIIRDFLD